MIEKSKIKKGLIFWNNCEADVQIPDSKTLLKIPVGLMQIEEIRKNNVATCTLYDKEYFGAQIAITVDYIEKHAIEVTLDDTDWQEMVDLHNTISFERFKEHEWSAATPDSLKERVNNFLCRDFYQKYNIKEVKKGDEDMGKFGKELPLMLGMIKARDAIDDATPSEIMQALTAFACTTITRVAEKMEWSREDVRDKFFDAINDVLDAGIFV